MIMFHKRQNIQKKVENSLSNFPSENTPDFFKCEIENFPSHWTAVIKNEGDYIFYDNIKINLHLFLYPQH